MLKHITNRQKDYRMVKLVQVHEKYWENVLEKLESHKNVKSVGILMEESILAHGQVYELWCTIM